MGCALGMIRWLIFLSNFIFALGGLALLLCGLFFHWNLSNVDKLPEMEVLSYPTTLLIIVGGCVFVIAFFGCCGAVNESHCMIVTFAMMLLTILVVQVAVASYGFVKLKDQDLESKINTQLEQLVEDYYTKDDPTRLTVDALQVFAECCGYNSYNDYPQNQYPYSCCGRPEKQNCLKDQVINTHGCKDKVYEKLSSYGKNMGIGAIVVAVVELVGVVFAFCLANSIKNAERRGYKV